MKGEIISIGDELIIGQIVNTNAAYLAQHLTALGIDIKWVTTVGDQIDDLKYALSTSMQRSDVIIATGGLGPTHDDMTKTAAAEYFKSKLIFEPEILNKLKQAFELRGFKMAAVNEEQAYVPEKARIINNPIGTAPGLLFEINGKKCFILPGVPAEMKAMCEATVFQMLRDARQTILQKTIRTTGIAESTLFERMGDIKHIEQFAKVAFLPKLAGVDIRLTTKGKKPAECEKKLSKGLEILQAKIGEYIYGYGENELEEIVAQLLIKYNKTIAVAESCTGGLLANKLTNISGSSQYFERGVVAYSNQAKMDILQIDSQTLEKYGAVSAEIAEAMATGVRTISGADFGLSTTGIAGPTGGTKEKPVGLVYIGLAKKGDAYSKKRLFFKDRLSNKERTVQVALNLLRKELLKIKM